MKNVNPLNYWQYSKIYLRQISFELTGQSKFSKYQKRANILKSIISNSFQEQKCLSKTLYTIIWSFIEIES